MRKRSIKTQLMISFFVVMLPVIAFLVANNQYANNVVRDKVSETYLNTLDIFVRQTDRNMREINDYLYKMAVLDSDVGLLMSFPYGSDHYMLTKIRIQNKINRDIGFYNMMDTVFLYNESDIIMSTSESYNEKKQFFQRSIADIIDEQRPFVSDQWALWRDETLPGRDILIKVSEVQEGLYVGAIVMIDDLLNLLSIQWDDGDIGEAAVYRRDNGRLMEALSNSRPAVPLEGAVLDDRPYRTIRNAVDGNRYMTMNRSSEMADIAVNIVIPESYMLQGLPYFQKATYLMACGLALIFAIYLFFIRQMLFKPLQQLIAGMKKLSLGMLDVRLRTNETVEFVFLANTFNNMAEQIKSLRIGMYEEQLRAQKIELKQLQAQINPHFYMNSLNIIYNFAALKDHDSVKKMSLHLGDYFRFIMRINRDYVSLDEELKHIANYIEIQKFRFPGKLMCTFDVDEPIRALQLPALSLQPFVENAIIHGFVNRRDPFRIRIECGTTVEGGRMLARLAVRDSGTGFPREVLERLNRGGDGPLPQGETSRLGILNVIQRLKLRYGGETDIRFANDAGTGGASVEIRLPLPSDYSIGKEASALV